MKAEDLLHKLLGIEAPWQVVRIREDLGKHQIDVWVGLQTGKSNWLFGTKTATVAEDKEHAWRHVGLGGTRCMIHAEANPESATKPWRGEVGQPFTNAMSHQIVDMIRDGIRLQSICTFLDITVGDLWKFKHGLDSGKTGLMGALAPSAMPADDSAPASRVPGPESAIWQGLLESSINIDIRVLSLKLLLTRMRDQMRVIIDPEVRALKCNELQQFFVRYEKTLGHELTQIEKLV